MAAVMMPLTGIITAAIQSTGLEDKTADLSEPE